jgi:hypothetical protein
MYEPMYNLCVLRATLCVLCGKKIQDHEAHKEKYSTKDTKT